MNAQIEFSVYRNLVSYLSDTIPLTEFRRRFDTFSWDTEEWNSDLLSQIELALAEFSSGHRTEQELRDLLQVKWPTPTVQIEPLRNISAPLITSGANNQMVKPPVAIVRSLDSSVGKLYEVVSE